MIAVRKDGLLTHDVDGELVICDPDRNLVHTLNPTARLVWELCDGVHGLEDIVAEITGRFGAPEDTVTRDVEGAMARLASLGLICEASPPE